MKLVVDKLQAVMDRWTWGYRTDESSTQQNFNMCKMTARDAQAALSTWINPA